MSFQTLGLNPPILKALEACGYTEPTPIQTKAIPPALAGRDVLGCARTGTGKTCAFGAPILQRLAEKPTKDRAIRALILTPTRELAIQIGENLLDYGKHLPLRSTVIFGGVGQAPQVDRLKKGVDILTATPGRLIDLFGQKLIDLSKVEIFVLDEADRMLDMGFVHDVRRILAQLPENKQTLFFSATMPLEVTDLVNSLLHDPVRVSVDPVSSPVEVIRQEICMVDRANKTKLLAALLRDEQAKNALVFTRTKHGADKVTRELGKEGVSAAAIHGNKSQTARQEALAQFKKGQIQVLVATDIAARGLDIEELSHVFNYNLPEVPETYIHRIGRTGRAGHGGTAISFCDFSEKPLLRGVETLLGHPIPQHEDHDWPMENFEAVRRDSKGRPVNADDAEARAAARAKKEIAHKQIAPEQTPQASKRARAGRKKTVVKEAAKPVQMGETPLRPDPLKGEVILDATARLLATKPVRPQIEKPRSFGKGRTTKPTEVVRATALKKAEATEKRAWEASKTGKPPHLRGDVRRNARRSTPRVEGLRSKQKDSTEQPSLMKPYYIDHD